MAQQTFIIKVFTDAETYSDALKTGKDYGFVSKMPQYEQAVWG